MQPSDEPSETPRTLRAAETHVVWFALDLAAARVEDLSRRLSSDETERAGRFLHERDRRRYVVCRARLREILAPHLGTDATGPRFAYGPQGKPALAVGDGRLRFNLSRSHERGVVALRLDAHVGVDIERIQPVPEAMAIAERIFAAEEHRALRAVPPADFDAAFLGYWTRKEAVVKSTGLGLSYPVNRFVLTAHPSADAERVDVADDAGPATRWVMPLSPPDSDYAAALATEGPAGAVTSHIWDET